MDSIKALASDALEHIYFSLTLVLYIGALLLGVVVAFVFLVRLGGALGSPLFHAFGYKHSKDPEDFTERSLGGVIAGLLVFPFMIIESMREGTRQHEDSTWTMARAIWMAVRVVFDAAFFTAVLSGLARLSLVFYPVTEETRSEDSKKDE